MRAAVIGAGPAGLYFATLLKRLRPESSIEVFEQNPPDATFGFGVVFSDTALEFLEADDPETHALITPCMQVWDDITIVHRGETVTIDGIGFAAIARLELLKLLQQRAAEHGIRPRYEERVEDDGRFDGYDVVVGADGVNSLLREAHAARFGTSVEHLGNRFVWYGTERPFDTLTQTFIETAHGPANAHHYLYTGRLSTFIVELAEQTWRRAGLAEADEPTSRAWCEAAFSDTLGGAPLISNKSHWRQFPVVRNARWSAGNRVLIGDALHTAHFSIGSGTRLALEDAIALAKAVAAQPHDVPAALEAYEAARRPVLEKLLAGADASAAWYERFPQHMRLEPLDFAMSYIGRSGRVDEERLAMLAPNFMQRYRSRAA